MNMNVLTPEVKQQLKDLDLYFSDNEDFDKYFISNSCHDDKRCQEEHEPCYEDALATPIIQVFSVTVDTSFDDDRLCEIYGSIRTMEGQNTSINLYERYPEDSESIQKHGTLSLIGPNDEVMFPFTGVTLDFCLRDKIREVEVIKGNVSFDSLIGEGEGEGDYFDKLMKVVVKGEYGLACVHYAIFQFGILGTLEVAFTEVKGNSSGYFSNIYGSLVATYGNSRQYCCTDDDLKYFESVLLRKPSDQQIQITVGNPIQLSRYGVVVPAYSSIRVEANLRDSNGRIIDDYIDFEVQYRMLKAKTKAVEDIDQEEMQKKCRRLCSVVRGKDGFAAVHYMIFSNAFKAHVEVRLFSKSPADASANVCGHLVAYYRGCDYSNSYQKKYYRSRLLYVPQNNSVEIMMGSNITLSRSVVAVPAISSLYIEAD
ncbi:Ketimine reductase mu-crystallin [Bienertia sinuspersici]